MKNDEHLVIQNGFEAGNKGIFNLGKLIMVGAEVSHTKTRLAQNADAEATSIYVDSVGDWSVGDKIAVSPTFANPDEGDVFIITGLDASENRIDFATDEKLNFRHYGAASSDFAVTGGVDVRAEVIKLNRNILVRGEDTESWGG